MHSESFSSFDNQSSNRRYLLYARKSMEDKKRQVQSIGDQIKELRALASRRGLHVVGEIREERSAKEPGRPLFEGMLESIRRHEADGILVWNVNRLLRNPVDQGTIAWMLQRGEIASIVTMDKEYLPGDNVVLLSVESAVANQFIIDLRRVTMRGAATKVENGWLPSKAPIGYLNNVQTKTIESDPERFLLVKQAWSMLLSEEKSVSQILQTLNDELNFRTPAGGGGQRGAGHKPLHRNTLYRIYSNVFYAGYFVYRGAIHKGRHEAMVTLEEMARAKVLLGREQRARPKKRVFAFTGLMRCGRCGDAVTAETHHKLIKSTGERRPYTYYRCCNRFGRCDKRGVSQSALQAQFDQLLESITIPAEFRAWGMREIERWRGANESVRQAALEQNKLELASINRQIDTLLELRLKDVISDEDYTCKRNELIVRREMLGKAIEEYDASRDSQVRLIADVLLFCEQAKQWFADGKPNVQRLIARALGARYELNGQHLRIEIHPLLAPFLNADLSLKSEKSRGGLQVCSDAEKDEFEPTEIGFQSQENGDFKGVKLHWGTLWGELQNVVSVQQPPSNGVEAPYGKVNITGFDMYAELAQPFVSAAQAAGEWRNHSLRLAAFEAVAPKGCTQEVSKSIRSEGSNRHPKPSG